VEEYEATVLGRPDKTIITLGEEDYLIGDNWWQVDVDRLTQDILDQLD
jgi:hypothetical protein